MLSLEVTNSASKILEHDLNEKEYLDHIVEENGQTYFAVVDLNGDERKVLVKRYLRPYSRSNLKGNKIVAGAEGKMGGGSSSKSEPKGTVTYKDGSKKVAFNSLSSSQKKQMYDNGIKSGEITGSFSEFKTYAKNEEFPLSSLNKTTDSNKKPLFANQHHFTKKDSKKSTKKKQNLMD